MMDIETNFAPPVSIGAAAETVLKSLGFAAELDFHLWRGASGRGYGHAVYSLIGCPEVVSASYLLVQVSASGRRTILHAGHTGADCGSINLATIRRLAARLGANEVHVLQLAAGDAGDAIVADLIVNAAVAPSRLPAHWNS